ncbi:hypothetical protein RWH45_10600 [Microbacterium sp. KSW4-17]|uniref:Uncharacterized protein n=1 Tax=Microbacterium galbum TaxID=3075994 RepID=A0ABU3T8H3_9MICO|nr:hypothetical protein [Microbacterium sp. KSW4-17]MDU0367667.1 hypothetical protein [Microbacterium sp. KSW4-17]
MILPSNFNDVVNATLADRTMNAHQKAYLIGSMFLPVDAMFEVLDGHHPGTRGKEHLPPPPAGEFGVWEAAGDD